jgi:long-chain fatty acid transport protein
MLKVKTKPQSHLAGSISFTLFLALASCPSSVFGLGIALPDQDAFATARGNAFVATADDPAAVFYNPAGISQLQGMNASVGAYGIVYGDTYHNGGSSIDSKTPLEVLPQIFTSWNIPSYKLTLGFGSYSPYGLRQEWPASSPFVAGGETGQINYYTIIPIIAYQLLPSLSIAAGPAISYSEADLKEFPGFVNHFRGRDTDVGFNAGVLWHPWDQHSFGVTYRSATDMNYKGHTTDYVVAPPFPNTAASANFHFPQTLAFGYSYRPTLKWNFEADANWTDWSELKTVPVSPLAAFGDKLTFDWSPSWMLDFGATRYIGAGWRVSGGYMYSMNSVPSSSFSPLVPDSDRHIFSIGVGKQYHKFSWDAAYQLAWGPSRSVSGDTAYPLAAGSYQFLSHALTINFGYHF